ncbi:uncharacterized protein LOC110638724 [Hevea brasiliensis]|uniref:uncharacterized protein LOC110638724 n=1 Tax=Hevea brasiliensis TaxID=3981 RepID=UPI0025D3339C|nr:uncharacterized protein LOC110638724 [Hevea brasiliensis]
MVNWRMPGFYGFPERNRRYLSWDLLRQLSQRSDIPWVLIGNFNDLLAAHEKERHLGYVGSKFRWERGNNEDGWVRERLDHSLAFVSWRNQFANAKVFHLDTGCSDHVPLFLNIGISFVQYRVKRFHFENAWIRESDCRQRVELSWLRGLDIKSQIACCTHYLYVWAETPRKQFKERKDVTRACLRCLNDGAPLPGSNDTAIVLIPKKKSPEVVADVRPISLCNIIDKIVTKALANSMKGLLSNLISEIQSAFVPRRLKMDNVMIAFELLHYLKRRSQGKNSLVALKTDMSKLWWRSLCPIIPKRGLRQKDPLSPYLFIICAEGLSALLRNCEQNGFLHGFRVTTGAPSVSLLFLADNAFYFFKASKAKADIVKSCLHTYEKASGEQVNLQKSVVSFSPHTTSSVKMEICAALGVQQTDWLGDYLVLPSLIGRKKKKSLILLLIMCGRECKAGRESFSQNQTGSRWMSWKRMCHHKDAGGLGFHRLCKFNLALLAKQGWRLLSFLQSLVARIYKARYYLSYTFLEANVGHNPSFIWRSVWACQSVLKLGCVRRIGNGVDTRIWGDPWLANVSFPYIRTPNTSRMDDVCACDLMLRNPRSWNLNLLSSIFNDHDLSLICNIPLVSRECLDCWYWKWDRKGVYSIFPQRRNLLWRAIMNVLPTMDNLLTRVDVSSVATYPLDLFTLLQIGYNMFCIYLILRITVLRQDVVTIKWKPPDVGYVKCKFDTVLNHSSRTAGYGAVIQNSDGQWVMGKATRLVRTSDPILAEALGFKEVLSWLKGLALSNVQVESDCLQVVNAIHGSLLDFSYFGLLINDGKALLQELVNVSITFIKQSANQSAHTTVRLALSLCDAAQWGSIPPLFLEDVLRFDLSNI